MMVNFIFYGKVSPYLVKFKKKLEGLVWSKAKVRGKLCYRFLSDSILRLFYFYPICLVDVTPRTRKAKKELYERRQQQIGDENVLFYFPFISWVQESFNR